MNAFLPEIPSWNDILRKLGISQGVDYGEQYDSHIQKYYEVNAEQNQMIRPTQKSVIINWLLVGSTVLGGIYLLKKLKGK